MLNTVLNAAVKAEHGEAWFDSLKAADRNGEHRGQRDTASACIEEARKVETGAATQLRRTDVWQTGPVMSARHRAMEARFFAGMAEGARRVREAIEKRFPAAASDATGGGETR